MVHPPAFLIRRPARAAACLLSLATLAAQAQAPVGSHNKADPLDAKASVPALRFESSFKAFRRGADDKAIPWREANDTVTRIGGWRAYAREAQPAEVAAPASPAPGPSTPSAAAPAAKGAAPTAATAAATAASAPTAPAPKLPTSGAYHHHQHPTPGKPAP